ncbi:flippase [Thalassobacillus devorans]|uniref:flippase n=1 Tax=Thalassobacillus devorans TaxID=279813 RepID=UPI001592C914|nr:flippase [Thalassobacillus devorans]
MQQLKLNNQKIINAIKFVFMGKMSQTILLFFFTPIIVRMLGVEGYGEYGFAMSVIGLIMVIANFGQADAIRRYLPIVDRENIIEQYRFYSTITKISLSLILGTLTIGVLLIYIFNDLYNQNNILTYILIIVVISILYNNLQALLFGLHMQKLSEPLNVLNFFIQYSIGIILVYIGLGVEGVLAGYILGIIIVSLIQLFILYRLKGNTFFNALTKKTKKVEKNNNAYTNELLSFGGWMVIGVIIAQLLYQADVIMVRTMLSSYDVGLYKAALSASQILWIVPQVVQSAVVPAFSELWALNQIQRISRISSDLMKYVTLGLILLGGGLFVLAEPFIFLYFGEEFINAKIPLQILIIGTIGFGISRITVPLFQVSNKLKMNIYGGVIAVILNIGLNMVLIPSWGITGAALGTAISYFSLLITKYFFIKKIGITLSIQFIKFITLTTTYILLLFFISTFFVNVVVKILVTALLGFFFFIFIIFILKIVNIDDIKRLKLR